MWHHRLPTASKIFEFSFPPSFRFAPSHNLRHPGSVYLTRIKENKGPARFVPLAERNGERVKSSRLLCSRSHSEAVYSERCFSCTVWERERVIKYQPNLQMCHKSFSNFNDNFLVQWTVNKDFCSKTPLRWEKVLNLRKYLPPALEFYYQWSPAPPGLCHFQINKSLVVPWWGLINGCCCCVCLSVGGFCHSHHIHISNSDLQDGSWQRSNNHQLFHKSRILLINLDWIILAGRRKISSQNFNSA